MAKAKNHKNPFNIKEGKLNDEERVDNFLKILPETKINDFWAELSNARYSEIYAYILDYYDQYSKTVFSKFQNLKINKAYRDFNESFYLLNDFLITHFFLIISDNSHSRRDTMVFGLHPEMKYSEDEGKSRFWRDKLKELKSLSSKFYKNYKDLLEVMYNEPLEERPKELEQENRLKSIHLITHSVVAKETIFLVLDERFEMPIRFAVKNKKGGETCIKKLYDIVYPADASGKKVDYSKKLADGINNGLFRRARVKKYMKTHKFEKPTLVQKSGKGTLVLKNEIDIKSRVLEHAVPPEYQRLYKDKNR